MNELDEILKQFGTGIIGETTADVIVERHLEAKQEIINLFLDIVDQCPKISAYNKEYSASEGLIKPNELRTKIKALSIEKENN